MFYDDELNVNPKLVEFMNLIAREQRTRNVQWKLRGFIKAELFTNEQARAMYEAGFRWILVGFESGSPRVLKNINKHATRDDNSLCVAIAHRNGLKVKALMSVGHPGESMDTIRETEEWLLENKPDDFDLTIVVVYPGTPYYDKAVPLAGKTDTWVYTCKTGDRLFQEELDYVTTTSYFKGKPGKYQAYVFTDLVSSEMLVRERDRMEQAVRKKLNIPFNPSAPALLYEHSMGQPGPLPPTLLRTS